MIVQGFLTGTEKNFSLIPFGVRITTTLCKTNLATYKAGPFKRGNQ